MGKIYQKQTIVMRNSFETRFHSFFHLSLFVIKAYIIGLLLFNIFRWGFIFSYGNFHDIKPFLSDFIYSFFTGYRFDTVVITYGLVVLTILSLVTLLIPANKPGFNKLLFGFFKWFSTIVFTLFVIVLIIDFYYYSFFNSHINITFFGFFDDDTKAVWASVWTDYPFVMVVLAIVASAFLFHYVFKKLVYKPTRNIINRTYLKIIFIVLLFIAYGLGMRCSFGNVPLEYMESSISANSFINEIPMNGLFALKNAIEERNENKININENDDLARYGFASEAEATALYAQLTGCQENNLFTDSTKFNKDLETDAPNIVLVQMESMSSFYFDLNCKRLNTQGSLEEQLKKCIVFQNFFPCRNLTIYTLDGMLLNSPKSPLSQSVFMSMSFPTSALAPYGQNNYNTTFISGGRKNWRNLDKFLPLQGFDSIEGGADIKKNIPNTLEEHEWGDYDEFMFDRIFQMLSENNKKPRLVYAMTITNHTPYRVPANYTVEPIEIAKLENLATNADTNKLRKSLMVYQYANNCLGNFIKKISESKLAENTIIVAFGDHSEHRLPVFFSFSDKDFYKLHSVPCIFYIPEKYKAKLKIDTQRFGSHKDIFPTLYNLSLSKTKYYKSGNNLFASNVNEKRYYALFNFDYALNNNGLVALSKGNKLCMHWSDIKNHLLNYGDTSKYNSLTKLRQLASSYSILMNMNITKAIEQQKKH
jgi:phosphoglycerol transferase MdoB-like AlkP superfamily enzyme